MNIRTRAAAFLAASVSCAVLATGTAQAAQPAQAPVPGAAAAAPAPLLPEVGAGTHFLDHASYLKGMNDPDWYEANIPFVDLPDSSIQDVYYYRWRVWKEHLRYTNPTDGWIQTEFLDCCGYAAPYQAVDAAAGHQITEGRWVRDTQYGDDFTRFWLTGPGAGPKPATDGVNKDTTDWAHEYSFWLASAAYGRAQVTGDFSQLVALLPQLEKQYAGWDGQFDADLGLYWSVPVWDAMELSASSYASDDPYHGGAGYRPTINAYQYGDAVAISHIASIAGDTATAKTYAAKAAALKKAMQKWLWDPQRTFYFAMQRDDNPDHQLLDTREEIGFVPWQFDAADDADSGAWAQLLDPQGFAAPYGPTTAERRSPEFDRDASSGCCHWNGPSWPFSTSQTLTGLANLLDDGPAQDTITAADYAAALQTYAKTQFKDGKPYVAEAHSADDPTWIYDGANHSEDYNHSTYDDLVLSGLLGLRPQSDGTLRIAPLVPKDWTHYAVENVPYHGHNVTVLWDKDGSAYGQGAGMHVYVDGALVRSADEVTDLTVTVGAVTPAAPGERVVNDAANPLQTGYPKPIASNTWRTDDPWRPLDGKLWFDEVPEATRWTNYSSPNASDSYGVDFGVPTRVDHVRWYGYDDGGGVRAAAAYALQYLHDGEWVDVPGQTRSPSTPAGNGPNDITFPAVSATALRLGFTNPAGAFVGVGELQSWSVSSRDASVVVGPRTDAGTLPVDGATTVQVDVTNTTSAPLTAPSTALAVPPGWSQVAVKAPTGAIAPGATQRWTFTVTPSADAAPGTLTDVVATAAYTGARGTTSTHTRQQVTVAYPQGKQAPVGTWLLDEGQGTVGHDTADGHDLTVTDGVTWGAGKTDGSAALAFTGKGGDAHTAGPVVDTAGNFSVFARVRLDSTNGWATAVSQDGTTTSGFFLQYSQADKRFAFSTGEGRALADAAPVTGQWYDLVGVHDASSGTYTLYVDGVAQKAVWHQATGDAAPGPFAVGRGFSQGRGGDFWPGAIDAVQAWDRVLSAADVAAMERPAPAAWTPAGIYGAGDQVSYDGRTWQATWWTQNQEPGDPDGPWQELAPAGTDGVAPWTSSRIYVAGDTVSYQGVEYRARWWTRHQAPGDPNGPWERTEK